MKTVDAILTQHNRRPIPDEQRIYDHLLLLIEQEAPEQMIHRFRTLFLGGDRYPDADVAAAMDRILSSATVHEAFPHILNRCCHILINRWQSRPHCQLAIPLLVELFESVPESTVGFRLSRSSMKLRSLVCGFRLTEQYAALRRLARVLSQSVERYGSKSTTADPGPSSDRVLGSLIQRYPYLYQHCLLSDRSTQEQQNTVQTIQARAQRKLELDLSRYITTQVRQPHGDRISTPGPSGRTPASGINPTLLPDRHLNLALKHYSGKVIGGQTYQDVAQSFIRHSSHPQSFAAFKDDLYEYIVSGVDASYGQRQFNTQLYQHLKQIFPTSETKVVNDFLIVRTCSQLLNFLVVDNDKCPQHFVFVDLVTNLGPILTTGLLLRIVLFCRKIRPYLERRFSILFNHYEHSGQNTVQWLVHSLELLNVALVTNFGRLDLSLAHKMRP